MNCIFYYEGHDKMSSLYYKKLIGDKTIFR